MEGKLTMQSPRELRRRLGRHSSTATSLWSMMSSQAKALQSSESTGRRMAGQQSTREGSTTERTGERPTLQTAGERPMVQRSRDPTKGCDSEEDWCWVRTHPGSRPHC